MDRPGFYRLSNDLLAVSSAPVAGPGLQTRLYQHKTIPD